MKDNILFSSIFIVVYFCLYWIFFLFVLPTPNQIDARIYSLILGIEVGVYFRFFTKKMRFIFPLIYLISAWPAAIITRIIIGIYEQYITLKIIFHNTFSMAMSGLLFITPFVLFCILISGCIYLIIRKIANGMRH